MIAIDRNTQTGSPGMIGGARCHYHLRQILVFLDAYVLNKPEVIVSQVMPKVDAAAGELTDALNRSLVSSQVSAFSTFARRS